MNTKENVNFKKLAAGATAAAMIASFNLAGCDMQVRATNETTTTISDSDTSEITTSTSRINITTTLEETTSETTTPVTETIAPTTETTIVPTTRATTKETTKKTTTTVTSPDRETPGNSEEEIIDPITTPVTQATTTETTPTPTTTPATVETIKAVGELEGVAPERLQFTKDLLSIYGNCNIDDADDFKVYLSREQIINYGKTGEGLNVINYDNGTPAIALVNCQDNVVSSFQKATNEMKAYDACYLEILHNRGVRAFMVNRWNNSIGPAFTYHKNGLIVWNADSLALAPSDISFYFKKNIETEAIGIKVANLGGDYANYGGFMKQLLSSDCWWNLYKKTGNQYCHDMSQSNYMIAKVMYNQVYAPETFQDEKIQNLLKNVRDKNLVSPFGGPWSEIGLSISDRPDWS